MHIETGYRWFLLVKSNHFHNHHHLPEASSTHFESYSALCFASENLKDYRSNLYQMVLQLIRRRKKNPNCHLLFIYKFKFSIADFNEWQIEWHISLIEMEMRAFTWFKSLLIKMLSFNAIQISISLNRYIFCWVCTCVHVCTFAYKPTNMNKTDYPMIITEYWI